LYVPDDAFWLVWSLFTKAYHASDLGLPRPGVTFTNLYHRDRDWAL
jgi:hypothetical protein